MLDLTATLRAAWHTRTHPQNLTSKSVTLIWDALGSRNRVSFELGIAAMSGTGTEFPIAVVQICPPGYAVDPMLLDEWRRGAAGRLAVRHDLDAEVRDAHVIYTDCWPRRTDPTTTGQVALLFAPYQVTALLLERARADVLFLPCPPVTRGEEVSAEAMARWGHHVYAAKEYLLHAQNAVLTTLL